MRRKTKCNGRGWKIKVTAAFLALTLCLGMPSVPSWAGNGSPERQSSVAGEAEGMEGDADGSVSSVTLVDPIAHAEEVSAVLYDNTNGLPTSEANVIVEDGIGFIWIGSYSGLIRYDGNTFERMDSTTGIASVVSLFVDSRERLWIGTNDSGVAVKDKDSIRIYNKSDGLKSLSIRAVAEDTDGTIYIATTHGIARVDEDMKLRMVDEPQINDEYVRNITMGGDGIIYGITLNGAIFTMEKGRLTGFYEVSRMGISGIHSILPDREHSGFVYVGTKNSVIYYGELQDGFRNARKISTAPLEYINAIIQKQDQIWVCADNGIGMIKDGKCTKVENIPMDSSVENMTVDYQGNAWFTSSKQGVMKIVSNPFQNLFDKYGLESDVINTTCMYQDLLFVGGKNTGLKVLDQNGVVEHMPLKKAVTASGKNIGQTDLLEMLKGGKIRSIFRDSKGRLWIATFGNYTLLRYEDGVATVFTKQDGLPSDRARAVFERKNGNIMVACTGGLVLIDGDEVTEVYDEASGISNTEVLTVTEADNGDMLVGTDGDGIYVINGTKVAHIGTESGLSSDVVMRIKRDRFQNIYWIVSSNSIGYLDENYQTTTVRDFPYSNNFDLYENAKGDMWVLSSNGIYVTPSEELIANGEVTPVYYGRDNGVPCITTSNSYSELTESGELYIAGTTGVAMVNIDSPIESVSELKMAVPYVEADGERIYADAGGIITIPAKVRKLTIYGYVYTYSMINPEVTYYLEGFEKEMTTVRRSELNPVDYTNLKGGNYHFVMQIADAQRQSKKELSVLIVKQKAFHEMLWFRILCVVIGLGILSMLVAGYVRYKTKAFLKKEQENKTFIREMTEAFAKVIDMKDKYTNGHSKRVAKYTAMLAGELGLDEETIDRYYNIALLHDIGKIGVPGEVLNKNGKLTEEEFQTIKSHASLGYEALKDISIMPELAIGAGSHHERPDGKGYPKGLKGDEIPQVARIIAVADTFDAMYSDRPYRKRMNFDKVVSIIKEAAGTQLTPEVVDAFLRLVEKGEFRAPDDNGGGSLEDIDNIRKKYEQ